MKSWEEKNYAAKCYRLFHSMRIIYPAFKFSQDNKTQPDWDQITNQHCKSKI